MGDGFGGARGASGGGGWGDEEVGQGGHFVGGGVVGPGFVVGEVRAEDVVGGVGEAEVAEHEGVVGEGAHGCFWGGGRVDAEVGVVVRVGGWGG